MNTENWNSEDDGPTPDELEQERRAGLNCIRLARGAFAAGESLLGQVGDLILEGEPAHAAYQGALLKLAAFKEALELLHAETRRGRSESGAGP